MPEEHQNFEQVLEADIERLSSEIKMHEGRPEMKGVSGHEMIKKSLQTMTPAQTDDNAPAVMQVDSNSLNAEASTVVADPPCVFNVRSASACAARSSLRS